MSNYSRVKSTSFRVGEFVCNPQELSLTSNKQKHILEPKLIQLLSVLAANPGQVMSKDELISNVWPDRIVVEGSLKRGISELRKIFGDTREQADYIETIPRVGYRLLAEVSHLQQGFPDVNTTVQNRKKQKLKNWWLSGAAIVLLASLGMGVYYSGPPAGKNKVTLAILPAKNLTAKTALNEFNSMLPLILAENLSLSRNINMIANNSIEELAESAQSNSQIATRLGASHLLLTEVVAPDQVPVLRVKVWQQKRQQYISSEDFVITSTPILWEVASQVARVVRQQLDAAPLLTSMPITNHREAYRLYLQGIYYLQRRDLEAVQFGIAVLQQSLALDHQFAPAHAALAMAYSISSEYLEDSIAETYKSAKRHAQLAISLAPDLAEAQLAMARLHADVADFDQAIIAYQRSLQIKPSLAIAHMWLAEAYHETGQLVQSYYHLSRAAELDPMQLMLHINAAFTALSMSDSELADRHLQKIALIDPHFPFLAYCQFLVATAKNDHKLLEALTTFDVTVYDQDDYQLRARWMTAGLAASLLADFPEAVNAFAQAKLTAEGELIGHWFQGLGLTFEVYAKQQLGMDSEMLQQFTRSFLQAGLDEYPSEPSILFHSASLEVLLGNTDLALMLLEKSLNAGMRLGILLPSDPRWFPMHEHNDFQDLLNKMLAQDARDQAAVRNVSDTEKLFIAQ